MGWAVGWDRDLGRWRGYGVPAYCDAEGCRTEIDRGLSWVAIPPPENPDEDGLEDEDFDDLADGAFFTCSAHRYTDVNPAALPPEHPEWVAHVLTDESWAKWRDENPEQVAALTATSP